MNIPFKLTDIHDDDRVFDCSIYSSGQAVVIEIPYRITISHEQARLVVEKINEILNGQ